MVAVTYEPVKMLTRIQHMLHLKDRDSNSIVPLGFVDDLRTVTAANASTDCVLTRGFLKTYRLTSLNSYSTLKPGIEQ